MSIRTLTKLALVAIAAAVIPACGSSDKNRPPLVVDWTPIAPNDTNVGRMPNIIVKFDRAMDPSTVTNVSNWAVVKSGAVGGVTLAQVEYLPQLFEARIVPNALLDLNAVYGLFVGGAVSSSEGIPVGGTFLLEDFTTSNAAGANTIAFGGATAAAGVAQGTIDLTWTKATEGGVDVANYDVFLSTTSGGEDLLVRTAPLFQTSSSLTGMTLTGLTPGTQYFIKVQPRSGATGCVFTALAEISATAAP